MRNPGRQDEVVEVYHCRLWRELRGDTPARREIERLAAMADGILVCFCAPRHSCHGDVVARAIE